MMLRSSVTNQALTWHDVSHQSERQAQHVDQQIGTGEVRDEQVCRWPHPGATVYDPHHETVAYDTDSKHQGVGDTEENRDGERMSEFVDDVVFRIGAVVTGVVHLCRRHVRPPVA